MPAGLQDNLELSQLQRQSVVTAWRRYLSCVDAARQRSRQALDMLRGQAGPASRQEDQFLLGNTDAGLKHSGAEVSEVGARWVAGVQGLWVLLLWSWFDEKACALLVVSITWKLIGMSITGTPALMPPVALHCRPI